MNSRKPAPIHATVDGTPPRVRKMAISAPGPSTFLLYPSATARSGRCRANGRTTLTTPAPDTPTAPARRDVSTGTEISLLIYLSPGSTGLDFLRECGPFLCHSMYLAASSFPFERFQGSGLTPPPT